MSQYSPDIAFLTLISTFGKHSFRVPELRNKYSLQNDTPSDINVVRRLLHGRVRTLVKNDYLEECFESNSKRPHYRATEKLFRLLKEHEDSKSKVLEVDEQFRLSVTSLLRKQESEIRISLKAIKALEAMKDEEPNQTDVINLAIRQIAEGNEDIMASIKGLEALSAVMS
ncbi:MAG TPA: hypothetical protein DG048_23305 [Pseudoalteromonas sp.]|jgi:hypothetical protein|nr:hypothetical protein [Pseudoalteromonas sp.]|tara:strand:- start:628 stop:1137 length:510 start_codon:yes stop_codon:yes gene_type:complete